MRAKFLVCIVAIFLISYLTSCAKVGDNSINTSNASGKVKTLTTTSHRSFGTSVIYENYFYKSDGTVDNVTYSRNNLNYFQKIIYTYNANKVITTSYDSANIAYAFSEMQLGVSSRVDSIVNYLIPPIQVYTSKIFYDSNNYPTQIKYYTFLYGSLPTTPPDITSYLFSNGNMMKMWGTNYSYIKTYDYYDRVSNLTTQEFGLPYISLQSINLEKTLRIANSSTPNNTYISESYTYTFDNNNRVATQLVHIHDNNGIDTGEYIQKEYVYY